MLSSYSTVSFSQHERTFLLQETIPNTETHNWTMYKKWKILENKLLNGMSSVNLFSSGSQNSMEEEVKILRASEDEKHKWNIAFQTNRTDAHIKS